MAEAKKETSTQKNIAIWSRSPTGTKTQPNTANRYLGVQMSMNGNCNKELKILKERNENFIQMLIHSHFTQQETRTIYQQCYLPTVTYPPPATTMPVDHIQKSQKQVTTAFLLKIGYPWMFPRAVVFAPNSKGGIGFQHLGMEQGVQKVIQLLKHVQVDTPMGKIITILLGQAQLSYGISWPLLNNTRPIPWCTAPWLKHLKEFLQKIEGQIIHERWTPKPRQQGNKFIMEEVLKVPLKQQQYKILNNICISLKVIMLSDIAEQNGLYIRQECLTSLSPLPNKEEYYDTNSSTLVWPNFATPNKVGWHLWKCIIKQIFPFNRDHKLRYPLGPWNEQYNTEYQWSWQVCPTTFNLDHWTQNQWKLYCPHILNRMCVIYKQAQVLPVNVSILEVPAILIIHPNQIIITLPIPTVPTLLRNPTPIPPSLFSNLTTLQHQWEESLQYRIWPHANLYQLHEQLAQGKRILLVNDASINHKGHGTLAWIIHTEKTLWLGKGIAPRPTSEMYSGLFFANSGLVW